MIPFNLTSVAAKNVAASIRVGGLTKHDIRREMCAVWIAFNIAFLIMFLIYYFFYKSESFNGSFWDYSWDSPRYFYSNKTHQGEAFLIFICMFTVNSAFLFFLLVEIISSLLSFKTNKYNENK